MKTIKGFDKDLKCRGYQYEVGKTYECSGDIEVCANGFHAISEDASPLSVFNYYPPTDEKGNPQRYCEVEADGTEKRDGDKIACSKLTVGAEIGIPGLVKAHVEWVKAHVTNENNADKGEPATSRGKSFVGKQGVAVVEDDDDHNISEWKAAVVDGERIKADTWYTLKDGEFVEVEEVAV